jgi:hypothetical protein
MREDARWIGVVLLAWWFVLVAQGPAGAAQSSSDPPLHHSDPCWRLLRQSTAKLQEMLDSRLRQGFPITQQLDEGNARLSPLAIQSLDCDSQRVVASGTYEFRGNLGVMDITRRGTTVMQWRLRQPASQHHVALENPAVVDMTFDNPAPWFDGTAIRNWALQLFARPICVDLQSGQPC